MFSITNHSSLSRENFAKNEEERWSRMNEAKDKEERRWEERRKVSPNKKNFSRWVKVNGHRYLYEASINNSNSHISSVHYNLVTLEVDQSKQVLNQDEGALKVRWFFLSSDHLGFDCSFFQSFSL